MNQRILKWVVNRFKILSDLFEDEIADFENKIIYLIEVEADLVLHSFLFTIINIDHI